CPRSVTLSLHCSPPFYSHYPPSSILYTLSLHDALPISPAGTKRVGVLGAKGRDEVGQQLTQLPCGHHVLTDIGPGQCRSVRDGRSEEHTSELQSRFDLVCRLLLEKKEYKDERAALSAGK